MMSSATRVTPMQTATPTTPKDQGADERHVLVLGPSGVGKSTFINAVSGSTLRIGTVLGGPEGGGDEAKISLAFFVDGQCYRLVDTPGFDEASEKSDTDVLSAIASYLASEYANGKKVTGVIYMHSIATTRLDGSGRRNINMFQKMSGRTALKNAVVVTTRWDQVKPTSGASREKDLRTKSTTFQHLFAHGAEMFRFDRTQDLETMRNILRHFTTTSPLPLLIQREMVNDGKPISETTAGIELQKDFRRRMEESHEAMRTLKEEFADFKNRKDIPAARDVRKEMITVKETFNNIREDCRKLMAIKTAPQPLRIVTSANPSAAAAPSAAPPTPQTQARASGSGHRTRSHSRPRTRVNSLSSIPALPPQNTSRPHSRRNSFGSIPAFPPGTAPITSTPLNKGKGREVQPEAQSQVTFTRPREPSFSRRARRDSGAGRTRTRSRDVVQSSSRSRDSRRRPKSGGQDWDEIRFLLFVGLLLIVLVPMIQRSRSITQYA